MYTTSFIFTSLSIVFAFLFLFRRFAQLNLFIFSIFYALSAITRPFDITGIDNENLAEYLTSKFNWGLGEQVKYIFIYNLTLPFESYKTKFLVIILLSLFLIFISIRRLINFYRTSKEHKNSWNKYTFLILLVLPSISSVLYMIHLRQFLSFSIILFSIAFIISPSKYNFFIIPSCGILIALTHPIYLILFISFIPLLIGQFLKIKQVNDFLNYSFSFIFRFRYYLLIPFVLTLFLFGYQIYIGVFKFLPVLQEYSLLRDINLTANLSYLLPISILLFTHLSAVKIYSKFIMSNRSTPIKNISFRAINTYNVIFLLFTLIVLSIEYFAPSIYSIGRIKSALYPSLFITISLLGYHNKRSKLIINFSIVILFALTIFYNFYNRLNFNNFLLF